MGKMRVLNIIQDSIVDGVGMRATIFFSGCPHRCKGCHNPESWNINYGKEYTVGEIISEIQSNPLTQGVTLSGGDPLLQSKEILPLVKRIKELGYNIWIYTGYTFEETMLDNDMKRVIKLCDTMVDGKFVEELKDLTLPFRGSSNQRIINIKERYIWKS